MFGLQRRLIRQFPTPIMQNKSYYAAVYGNNETVPARINQDHDGNTLLQVCIEPQIWETLLCISSKKNGTCEKITYRNNIPKFNYWTFNQEWPSNDTIGENHDVRHSLNFYPKILFGVSQSIWDSFITALDNQEVIRLLNLQKHRHLWLGYNHAVGDSFSKDLIHKRAELIGKYHFLLSIADKETDIKSFYRYHQTGVGDFEGCGDRVNFPDSRSFDLNAIDCIRDDLLNKGLFDHKKMLNIHPSLNATLLKKLAHCTSIMDLCLLTSMISSYSKFDPVKKLSLNNQKNLSNDQRTFDAVNWVSSSTNSPIPFFNSLKMARRACAFTETIAGGLFFNSRKEWLTHNERNVEQFRDMDISIRDYVNELFNDLILRELLSQLQRKSSAKLNLRKAEYVAEHYFRPWFIKMVVNTYAINQIDKLQERWHRNIHAIDAMKSPRKGSWTPIIENTSLDDIEVAVLTSETALKAHGREMDHCVGGYGLRCRTGHIDIIVLMDSDHGKSTLEIDHINRDDIRIVQHRSYKNTPPIDKHRRVALTLVHLMNSGQLAVNQTRLMEVLSEKIDYDVPDLVTPEVIYQAYKDRQLLPTRLTALNYQQMLEKTHLNDAIDSFIVDMLENNKSKRANL